MSRATNDLNAVRMMIGPAVMYPSNTVLTFVAVIALMLSIERAADAAVADPAAVRVGLGLATSARDSPALRADSGAAVDISAVTQEALAGVRVVRAYRQEAFETRALPRTPTRSTSGATAG